jgi:hypothetical protein
MNSGWRRVRRALALASSLLAAMAAGPALASDDPRAPGRVPRPVIERGDGAMCVADAAFMRKNHMDLLKHQRDDTVRQGIRTPRFSLAGCINCHASKKTGSVIAEADNFCRSCHAYAGVSLDCFECHSARPKMSPAGAVSAQDNLGGKR